MSTTLVHSPTSHVSFGMARVDVTPPPNMYHHFWGAARHDRGTGIHRPLTAEVMLWGPRGGEPQLLRVQIDFIGLVKPQHNALIETLSEASGLTPDQIIVCYSHTHSAGHYAPARFSRPGGDLIPGFLADVHKKLRSACQEARANVQEVFVTYASGRCDMAADRDYWDTERSIYACGYNPEKTADDTVVVARIADRAGQQVASVVNYGCHPISLAWKNSLFSPDYVGALRETVEETTGAPCIFALGASGELMPKVGLVGDTAVADRNGQQLGYAALSALASMQPPASDFAYLGPVVSGATLGDWAPTAQSKARQQAVATFSGGTYTLALPMIPKPERDALRQEIADWQDRGEAADEQGDIVAARDASAYIERAVRWLARLDSLPQGNTYPFSYSIYRMGDAVWITCGGEPYSTIQMELRQRFPNLTLLFTPVAGEMEVAYLLPKECYGKGLYQEEPSILAAGCLEMLTESIAQRVEQLCIEPL